jgi:hypothetical protein
MMMPKSPLLFLNAAVVGHVTKHSVVIIARPKGEGRRLQKALKVGEEGYHIHTCQGSPPLLVKQYIQFLPLCRRVRRSKVTAKSELCRDEKSARDSLRVMKSWSSSGCGFDLKRL